MPKKKDKKIGDKQDEVKKTSKYESSATPADKTASDDKEKDLYLIQIRYLNEQLERWACFTSYFTANDVIICLYK